MKNNKIQALLKGGALKYTIILIIGVLLGWIIFGGGSTPAHDHSHEGHSHGDSEAAATIWTCAMHPQIRQEKPGKCPICGMDLTPLRSNSNSDEVIDESAIQLSPEAMALAQVETTIVSSKRPVKKIAMYGTVKADERLSQTQTAHIGGRIEKLFVNFTGERVQKGQTIATIYSPELLSAQQELLEAKKLEGIQPTLLEAAREKLRLWKLSNDQINKIEETGQIQQLVDIKANTSGVVIEKQIDEGDYVNQGSPLFKVANLNQVWVLFDAFEVDLPFLNVGDPIQFTLQAIPDEVFQGKISFIDPIINKTSRTAKVRIETKNPGQLLKPEMYASAVIEAPLIGKNNQNDIVVPKSAILWTGKRSLVYIKQPNIESNAFTLREVVLGPSLGNAYVIASGLEDGEEIVTNGTFVIDASAQLEGKTSMMNNNGDAATLGHQHHGGHNHGTTATEQHNHADLEEASFSVKGACDMCKDRIEKAALNVKGVAGAHWGKEKQSLHIKFDNKVTSVKKVAEAVATAGHDNQYYKANDEVYNALPGCCQYR